MRYATLSPHGMVSDTLYQLSVGFSLAAGSAAGLLSLLTWESLRRSPFGRAVLVFSAVLVAFIAYHVVLLVSPPTAQVAVLIKSATFTGVAAFTWLLVLSQRRLSSRPPTEGDG